MLPSKFVVIMLTRYSYLVSWFSSFHTAKSIHQFVDLFLFLFHLIWTYWRVLRSATVISLKVVNGLHITIQSTLYLILYSIIFLHFLFPLFSLPFNMWKSFSRPSLFFSELSIININLDLLSTSRATVIFFNCFTVWWFLHIPWNLRKCLRYCFVIS